MDKQYMSRADMVDIITRKNMEGYNFKLPRKNGRVIIECNATTSGLPDYEYGKDATGYYKKVCKF